MSSPTRRALSIVVGLVLALSLTVGCTTEDPQAEREGVMDRVGERYGGRLSDDEVRCYVDGVAEEVGLAVFDENAQPTSAQSARMTQIRIDCVGIEKLGRMGSSIPLPLEPEDTWLTDQPWSYGEDPELDALYDSCGLGAGSACDQLFDLAPPGSEYEEFGVTCGERTRELLCAEVYTAESLPAS